MGRVVVAALVVAAATVVTSERPAAGATFTVTSTSCSGPGSIVEAITQANANPGPDTISITPGLKIGPVSSFACGVKEEDTADFFIAGITDELVIQGNGAEMWGNQRWVKPDGSAGLGGQCPTSDSRNLVISQSPGLARIADGVDVRVEGMTFRNLSSFARLGEGSGLHLQNSGLNKIYDWYRSCDRAAIYARPGASVRITIEDSKLTQIANAEDDIEGRQPPFTQPTIWGSPMIDGKGDLDIEGSSFETGNGVVQWSGGTVDVVSSRFGDRSGWLNASSGTIVDIVNSALQGDLPFEWDPYSRIVADQASTVNITASTFVHGAIDCPSPPLLPDASCPSGPGAFISKNGSTINFAQSAVGVQLDLPNPSPVPLLAARGGTFTADEATWIQPLPGDQEAADLKAITGQPNLLTDPPGLPTGSKVWPLSHTPLLGTVGGPGKLIDVIPDSQCGAANQLLSPVDGSCITHDVLGNDRWDTGNDKRNIGAIQLTLSPHLAVASVGDGSVELSWSRPLDPPSGAITDYRVLYRVLGSGDPFTPVDVSGAASLTTTVAGLTNGTTYEFQVVAVNATGDGPPSNSVNATPSTTPGAPVLTAAPGDGQVALTWTVPPDGGLPIEAYIVQYRPAGATEWTTAPGTGTNTSTTITGLTNGTSYEFRVAAANANGTGPYSTPAITPLAPATTTTSTTSTTTSTTTTSTTSTTAPTDAPTARPTTAGAVTAAPASAGPMPVTGASRTRQLVLLAAALIVVGVAAAMVTGRRTRTSR